MLSAISVGGGAVNGSVRVWLRLEGLMALVLGTYRSDKREVHCSRSRCCSLRLNRRSLLAITPAVEQTPRSLEGL